MNKNSEIIEIFSSIQGEGTYIGMPQIFIRFSGCNLSCDYCDTPFEKVKHARLPDKKEIANPVSPAKLIKIIETLNEIPHHSVSLTGGEPLLQTEFLEEFLPALKQKFPRLKIYLETNGTLAEKLEKIINFIDIISMDLKLESSTGKHFPEKEHHKFLEIIKKHNKEFFLKIVFSKKISDPEINFLCNFINSLNIKEIITILQPISTENPNLKLSSSEIIEISRKFNQKIENARVIPQVHKFLDLL